MKTAGEYLTAIVLCLLILTWIMQLQRARLGVIFEYGGDAVYYSILVKGIMDHGWYLQNPSVGAPWGMDLYDFPMADNFNFLLIKLLTLFTSDYAVVFNLFFLLTFPLVTLASLFVLRHFNVSYLSSLTASLLYTFVPFHFFRNEHHLFLSTYYTVPLVVMVALWVASGALIGESEEAGGARRKWPSFRNRKFVAALLICLVASSVGWVYFAFFACFFLVVAGISATIYRRNARHLMVAGVLVGVIFAGVLANLLPNINYMRRHGDTSIARRAPGESEMYGLKITQLVLPLSHHRIQWLADIKDKYNEAPLVNENDNATLGTTGTIGFLALVFWLFYRKPDASHMNQTGERGLLNHLSVLNAAGVLLGTIGGLGALFALLVSPQIRTYNRISIYISFFALFAVALLLDRLRSGPLGARLRRAGNLQTPVLVTIFAALLILGVLDQTNASFIPQYERAHPEFDSNQDFVRRVEAALPGQGSMIFQLPYARFPEAGTIVEMPDYEHFKMYLQSRHLRWSYGVIRGREGDLWQKKMGELPVDELVEELSLAGFDGVYIDRKGYEDRAAELERKLQLLLLSSPIVSRNNELVFFDMRQFNEEFRQKFDSQDWARRSALALNPLVVTWGTGIYPLESARGENWRWAESEGELHIVNNTQFERRLTLEMGLAGAREEDSTLTLSGPLINESVKLTNKPVPFTRTLIIPPGRHTIKFASNGRSADAPNDPRKLVFRVQNFRYAETK